MQKLRSLILAILVALSGCVSDNAWYYYECESIFTLGGESGLVEGYVENRYMYILIVRPDQSMDAHVGQCRVRYVTDEEAETLRILEE